MYLPVVTPELPEAHSEFTTNYQGVTQTGKPNFVPASSNTAIDEKVPATFEDGSTVKVVPGEGTYTVSPDGTVTFVPEKDFIGTAKGVLVMRADTAGNLIFAAYIPTVTPNKPETETNSSPATQEKVSRQELPQTGTGSEFAIFGAAATAILAGLGMVAPTKKDEE